DRGPLPVVVARTRGVRAQGGRLRRLPRVRRLRAPADLGDADHHSCVRLRDPVAYRGLAAARPRDLSHAHARTPPRPPAALALPATRRAAPPALLYSTRVPPRRLGRHRADRDLASRAVRRAG